MRVTIVSLTAAFCALASVSCHGTKAEKRPPNVILIVADDLGYGDLGCYGGKIKTPHIDSLAREGARLTDFHVAQAVCGASRAAILTGCYPNRVSLFGAPNHTATHGLAASEQTIAELLHDRGYATAIIGKWHLGHLPQFLPLHNGFDEWFGLPYSNDMVPKPGASDPYYPQLPLYSDDRVIEQNPAMDTLTTRYTERAVQFVERHREQPFFLYLPHTMPHVPLGVNPLRAGVTGQGRYADVIAELDWSVGQVLEALARSGLADNTIVIFTSDNGPWLPYGNHAGSSGALREGKGTTFEGGVRVPCVLRWPDHVPAGSTVPCLTAAMDLLPTLASACRVSLPALPIDGVDLLATLCGDGSEPRANFYYYWNRQLQAVREGRWKLHLPHHHRTQASAAGRDGESAGEGQANIELSLFDLAVDQNETTDVAKLHQEIVARLQALAVVARNELGDSAQKTTGAGIRPAGQAPTK
ncbi:MAG: arylsulfatase [Planctomycetes bacterium]|nr:arylsulfatase [Planctomycetota bacterium]